MKQVIQTDKAPQPIGCYSQAIRAGNTVYLSGQIPLDPLTGQLVTGDFKAEVRQVFENIQAVVAAAMGDMSAIVKLTVFLTDMANFGVVNEVMEGYFAKPYPARSCVAVAALPRGVRVEVEAVMVG